MTPEAARINFLFFSYVDLVQLRISFFGIFFVTLLTVIETIMPAIKPINGLANIEAANTNEVIPNIPLMELLLHFILFLFFVNEEPRDINEITNNKGFPPIRPAVAREEARSANSSFSLLFHLKIKANMPKDVAKNSVRLMVKESDIQDLFIL